MKELKDLIVLGKNNGIKVEVFKDAGDFFIKTKSTQTQYYKKLFLIKKYDNGELFFIGYLGDVFDKINIKINGQITITNHPKSELYLLCEQIK